MRPEVMHDEFLKILENSFLSKPLTKADDVVLSLSDTEMFKLWNILGEELGIDLSLATQEQRQILFKACENGKKLAPKDFGSLLWLMYYGDAIYQ